MTALASNHVLFNVERAAYKKALLEGSKRKREEGRKEEKKKERY